MPGKWSNLDTALEAIYVDKLYVNDRNTDAAPSYAVMNARVAFAQTVGRSTLREFVRLRGGGRWCRDGRQERRRARSVGTPDLPQPDSDERGRGYVN